MISLSSLDCRETRTCGAIRRIQIYHARAWNFELHLKLCIKQQKANSCAYYTYYVYNITIVIIGGVYEL